MPILLIPGFETEASLAILPDYSNDPTAGFGVFVEQIQEGEAVPYRWGIARRFGIINCLNLIKHLELYQEEQKLANSSETASKLNSLFEQNNFEVVVCHSMGCRVFVNFATRFGIPKGLKKIIFVQADLPKLELELTSQIKLALKQNQLDWWNVWCYWDQALFLSFLLNHKLPIGLVGTNNSLIKSQFLPLWRKLNLHTSSINDPELLKLL